MKRLFSVLFLAVFLVVPAVSAQAVTWYVKTDGSDPGDCTGGHSWAMAYATIQEAVDCADPGDEIWVKKGTYALSAPLNINKAVGIYGGFAGTETTRDQRDCSANVTTVDGQDTVRCFYVSDDATIDGFTITRGNTSTSGAGMVITTSCSPIIANCTFSHNYTSTYGGGIVIGTSNSTITNCTFYDNKALEGGGIASQNCSPTITNCTFYDNKAMTSVGKDLRNYDASPTVTNCIMWSSKYYEISNYGTSSPTITYCDIYESGYAGSNGNISQDPLFVDPDNGDLHLQSTSPCVDAGNNGAVGLLSVDRDSDPRIADGNNDGSAVVDMGADEVVIWFVDGVSGTDPPPADCSNGHSWGTAYKTIQKAVYCTNEKNEIWVKGGTYTLASSIAVNRAVHLYGGFTGTETARNQRDWIANETTVDGNNTWRCFYVTADACIDGFSIINGYNNASGGGIYNYECAPTIAHCRLSENSAPSGGGIYNLRSTTAIANCTFLENSATSYNGGGICNNDGSAATITSCLFVGNTAGDLGGAIHNYQSAPSITNCSFAGNEAVWYGGAICNENSSSAVITNCVLWGDSVTNGSGAEIYNSASSPTVTYCDIDQVGYAGSNGNIRQDPLYVNVFDPDKANWDLHLQADSPCIDAGDNEAAGIGETDFEGDARMMDGDGNWSAVVDMGGDEYAATTYVILHKDGALWFSGTGWMLDNPPYIPGTAYARDLEFLSDEGDYAILHKDGALYVSTEGWYLDTPPYYPGVDYAVAWDIRGDAIILHRDGALWSFDDDWLLNTPPYYPDTDYARDLKLREDGSYVILHKDGAIYDSATGWVMDPSHYYPGSEWAVDMHLEDIGCIILHRDGALFCLIWDSVGEWLATTPPYYPSSDYARALEKMGSKYVILHKDGAFYDSVDGWHLGPYYPGTGFAVDLEVR